LLGSFAEIRRDPLAFLSKTSAEFGSIAHIRLGPYRVFLLNHPEDIEQILVTHQHKFIKGRSLAGARRLFGNGLLTSDGALHARQRRLVQPVFHRARLNDYAAAMTTVAADRSGQWRDGESVDIAAEMSALTLAITGRILFGDEGDAVTGEIRGALHTAAGLMEPAVLPFAALMDFVPLRRVQRFRAARAALDRAITRVIERRRRSGRACADVVSLLLSARDDAGTPMSMTQVRDEIITLLLASHETTANALAWTWYLLARHPAEDAALHAEVDAVLAGGRVADLEDIPNLPFTRMVLTESMRLYPPAWLLARVAVEDHEARGYMLPAGSLVVISPWVVHHNAAYYSDPLKFDPSRWITEHQSHRPRFSYFPFGAGARGCMGEAFAWMEGVLLLSTIARRWRMRLLDETAPAVHPALTLTPKCGIRVKLERRFQPGEASLQ
jgi:cytochrome P450